MASLPGDSAGTPIRILPAAASADGEAARLRRALAQLSTRFRRARRLFHEITGLTVVTALRGSLNSDAHVLPPPVHPLCAERLRAVAGASCDEQWHRHVRAGLSSQRSHSHVCPLGLHCACVPIYLAGTFVGLAKLVADAGKHDRAFSEATRILTLIVASAAHESYASVLRDELQALQQRELGRRPGERGRLPTVDVTEAEVATPAARPATPSAMAIVDRALGYLDMHHGEPELSLPVVAAFVGCHPKHLTQVFTRVVGQHMHAYIVGLRVDRAGRTLLDTDLPIKRIAADSGFRDSGQMARAFHRHVGVTPGTYRQIFSPR